MGFRPISKIFSPGERGWLYQNPLAQNPVKLYGWLLTSYAKPGRANTGHHLGSSSGAIAAHYGGLIFVGCGLGEKLIQGNLREFERKTRRDMFR